MALPYYLLLAFLAAWVFSVASLSFKRAFEEGAKLPYTFLINNILLGLVFLPGFLFAAGPVPWKSILQPMVAGAVFFLGNLASFLAIRSGDVSLAAPLMGSKVIFVGFLPGVLFNRQLNRWQWLAAGMTTVGVAMLGLTDVRGRGAIQNHSAGSVRRTPLGRTTFFALATAFMFALCDVCIQAWAGAFGLWNFLPLMFATVALLSMLAYPFFAAGGISIVPSARKWVALGAAGTVLQSGLVAVAIAWSNDAAGVNVVYSTRGLWSILLVWFLGGWFGSHERERGKGKMLWRTAGALLMTAAVFVTLRKGW